MCNPVIRFRTADSDAALSSHGSSSWTEPWITPRKAVVSFFSIWETFSLYLFDLDLRRLLDRDVHTGVCVPMVTLGCALWQEYPEAVQSLSTQLHHTGRHWVFLFTL